MFSRLVSITYTFQDAGQNWRYAKSMGEFWAPMTAFATGFGASAVSGVAKGYKWWDANPAPKS